MATDSEPDLTPEQEEEAVRRYLLAITDPSQLVDAQRVSELEAELESTTDPLQRVLVRNSLNRAKKPPMDALEEAFVSSALPWARERDVEAQPFLDEGVSEEILRRAGFNIGRPGRRRGRPPASATLTVDGRPRQRKPMVRKHEVIEKLPTQGQFTVNDAIEASGASTYTAHSAIQEAVEAGAVIRLGPDPEHAGRGRAPILYERK